MGGQVGSIAGAAGGGKGGGFEEITAPSVDIVPALEQFMRGAEVIETQYPTALYQFDQALARGVQSFTDMAERGVQTTLPFSDTALAAMDEMRQLTGLAPISKSIGLGSRAQAAKSKFDASYEAFRELPNITHARVTGQVPGFDPATGQFLAPQPQQGGQVVQGQDGGTYIKGGPNTTPYDFTGRGGSVSDTAQSIWDAVGGQSAAGNAAYASQIEPLTTRPEASQFNSRAAAWGVTPPQAHLANVSGNYNLALEGLDRGIVNPYGLTIYADQNQPSGGSSALPGRAAMVRGSVAGSGAPDADYAARLEAAGIPVARDANYGSPFFPTAGNYLPGPTDISGQLEGSFDAARDGEDINPRAYAITDEERFKNLYRFYGPDYPAVPDFGRALSGNMETLAAQMNAAENLTDVEERRAAKEDIMGQFNSIIAGVENDAALRGGQSAEYRQYIDNELMPQIQQLGREFESTFDPDLPERKLTSAQITEKLQDLPEYQFQLEQGNKMMERQAAARGGLLSGNTLLGAQKFGQDLAQNVYAGHMNRLGQLAGMNVPIVQQQASLLPQLAGQMQQTQLLSGANTQQTLQQMAQARQGAHNLSGNVAAQAGLQNAQMQLDASKFNAMMKAQQQGGGGGGGSGGIGSLFGGLF